MKIALGADHAGFRLKEQLRDRLQAAGHEVLDVGTTSEESTDYPNYAHKVTEKVVHGEAERGILVCATGLGMSIAANKVHGIRAGLAYNEDTARLTRAHNDANVLTLAQKYTPFEDAAKFVDIFLSTPFEGGRHQRRVNEITEIEKSEK